jgi:hypothetical protein
MNLKTWRRIIALTLFAAAMALPLQLAAQGNAKQHHPHQYHHYQIADPGTFGGSQSHQNFGGFVQGNLNNWGAPHGAAREWEWSDRLRRWEQYSLHFHDKVL